MRPSRLHGQCAIAPPAEWLGARSRHPEENLGLVRFTLRVMLEAFRRFAADDGWAIASHIALSILMALFPFVLVLTALAGFFGSAELADEAAHILLEAWPPEVAGPIATEAHTVLTSARGNALTIGAVLSLYFASSGVESLRVGLNRAYGIIDPRRWWLLRLESIAYVLIGAVALLAFAFLVLLAPLIWRALVRHLPALAPFGGVVTLVRLAVASILLVVALIIAHLWLPASRRTVGQIAPGIAATLLMWLASGTIFARYLDEFASSYSVYYAGLASVMIVIVFLYMSASIFVYGGELNAAIMRLKGKPAAGERVN
jgi:membrane protein